MARGELDDDPDAQHRDEAEARHLEQQFAAWGLQPEHAIDVGPGQPYYYLWPENVEAWNVFVACETQWRHGFGGPTGLDYAGVEIVFERMRIRRHRRQRMRELVAAMERGALQGWAERRAERRTD